MAAQTLTVRLQRGDSHTPWGFRLQGGLDFSTPLSIQRVTPGSLSDQTGLQAGDAILSIGNENVTDLKHKDAQDLIVRCGNYLELTVQRGAVKIWKPSITPVNELKGGPVQNIDYANQDQPLFRTSLAADKQDFQHIGSSHNIKPKPFISGGPPVGGQPPGTVKAVVHAQYNSPVGLYSSTNIADTLATQTQGLIQGIQGMNVNDNQTPAQSAVLQAVQQEDYSGSDLPSGMRKVAAPVTQPGGPAPAAGNQPLCGGCGRLIIGVFVRVNNKPLHAECFTCATCGTSLKNTGYFTINEKLYCETHARQISKPPGPNYEPVNLYSKPQQQQAWKPASPVPTQAPAPISAPSAGPARQPGSSKFQWPPPKPYPDSDNESDQNDHISGEQPAAPPEPNEPKPAIPSSSASKPLPPLQTIKSASYSVPQAVPYAQPPTPSTPGPKMGPTPFVPTHAPYQPSLPNPLLSKPTIPSGPKPFVPTYQATPPPVAPKPSPTFSPKPISGIVSSPSSFVPKPSTPVAEAPSPIKELTPPPEEESSIVEERLVTPSKAVWPPPKPGSQSTGSSSQGPPASKSLVQWPPPKPSDDSENEQSSPVVKQLSASQTQSFVTSSRSQFSTLQSITPISSKSPASSNVPIASSQVSNISAVPSAFHSPVPTSGNQRFPWSARPGQPPPPVPAQKPQSTSQASNLTFTPISPQPATQRFPSSSMSTAPLSPTVPDKPVISKTTISLQTSQNQPISFPKSAPPKPATSLTASNVPVTASIPAPTNPNSFGVQYGPSATKGKGVGAPNWMSSGLPTTANVSNVPWSMSAS